MRTISAFAFISLDGYYKGPDEDISWHLHTEEGDQFSQQQLQSGNILLFGRSTYKMMYGFWSSAIAAELYPEVASKMNAAEKMVLSNSLSTVSWNHTTLIKGDTVQHIKNLKQMEGKNISILGSGTIVQSLTRANLIDEYQLMIDPVLIGQGTRLFEKMAEEIRLSLVNIQTFRTGTVILTYQR